MQKHSISQHKLVSAEIEVLRQAGHDDWYMYSRYNPYGVGDLYRLDLSERKLVLRRMVDLNQFLINITMYI